MKIRIAPLLALATLVAVPAFADSAKKIYTSRSGGSAMAQPKGFNDDSAKISADSEVKARISEESLAKSAQEEKNEKKAPVSRSGGSLMATEHSFAESESE